MKGRSFADRLFGRHGARGSDGAGNKAVDNESRIVSFSYNISGSVRSGRSAYEFTREENDCVFTYITHEYPEYGEMRLTVTEEEFDELKNLYKKFRLAAWDGFSKYDPEVCDGSSFSLHINFEDGGKLSADGSNAFPDGYRAFVEEMDKIVDPLCEKVLEISRQEKIREGIHGTLSMIMAAFIDRGKSGRDEYHVLISKEGIRSENFDVRIKSVSGKYFSEGELKFYRNVPDELLNFSEVQEMAEKYGLINWYNYNKTAQDPNNEQWYQICLIYGDEFKLSSCGTQHPDNYEGFRDDFLRWLSEEVSAVEALPGG